VYYYSSPGFVLGGNIITLTHNTANTAGNFFLGYDLYYRAYSTESDAQTARQTIESASSATTSTPESVLAQLISAGFKKVYLASNPTVPPTPLLAGATTYTIQFPNASSTVNWYYTTNLTADTNDVTQQIQIVRGIGASGESFNYQYASGDLDYASTTMAVTSGMQVHLVFFAIAYGFDVTNMASIYSYPASLYQEVGGTYGYALP
jgi:hypothetical protein